MDDTPEPKLAAIERRLARIEAILTPIADAFEKVWPMLERRLDNPAARWRGRNARPYPGPIMATGRDPEDT